MKIEKYELTGEGEFWLERMGYAEPDDSRSKKERARLERWWRNYVKDFLDNCKRHFEKGHANAFWDAVIFCEQTREPKPQWAQLVLVAFARDTVNGRDAAKDLAELSLQKSGKKKIGAPSNPKADLEFFECAEEIRKERGLPLTKKGFPPGEVLKAVAAKLGWNLGNPDNQVDVNAARAVYERGKVASQDPDSKYVSHFLD